MITATAKLTIKTLPLSVIQVVEYQPRYLDKMLLYVHLLEEFPCDHAGLLHVTPSDTHGGMYALLDGHHKFVASIMTGRKDVLCVVVEDMKR